MRIQSTHLFVAALLFLWAGLTAAETFEGVVKHVVDGDTIDVSRSGEIVRVRLWGIDTPEMSQPYGPVAAEALREALEDKYVIVEPVGTSYDRVVGKVSLTNGRSVNFWIVAAGHGWVYPRYNDEPRYSVAQKRAQANKWGLWAQPVSQRVPPWKYRRAHN